MFPFRRGGSHIGFTVVRKKNRSGYRYRSSDIRAFLVALELALPYGLHPVPAKKLAKQSYSQLLLRPRRSRHLPWRQEASDPSSFSNLSSRSSPSQRGDDDRLRLFDNVLQMIRPAEAFRIDLVDIFRAGRACGEPAIFAMTFMPPIGALLPGACVRISLFFPRPGSEQSTCCGDSFDRILFCSGRGGRIHAFEDGFAKLALKPAYSSPGSGPYARLSPPTAAPR